MQNAKHEQEHNKILTDSPTHCCMGGREWQQNTQVFTLSTEANTTTFTDTQTVGLQLICLLLPIEESS